MKRIISILLLLLEFSLLAAVPVRALAQAILEVNGPPAQLTLDGGHYMGSFSPDGSKIVYIGADGIYTMNVDGSGKTKIFSSGTRPKWGPPIAGYPDGLIALAGTGITIIQPNGTLVKTINTSHTYTGASITSTHSLDWSADGSKIAFADQAGTMGIWVIGFDGTGLTQITDYSRSAYAPAWSPDGTEIACSWGGSDPQKVGVFKADGTGFIRAVSPDGRYGGDYPDWGTGGILYSVGDAKQLRLVNADGSGDKKVFDGPAAMVAWSPDGKRVAYLDAFGGNARTRGYPYTNIQDAVDAASSGNVINVAAGTYVENLNVNKTLTLLGAQAGVDPRLSHGDRSGTESIIDGSSGSSAVTVSSPNVTINGFTIKKGQAQAISGGSSNLSILYNKFSENGWNSSYCYVYIALNVSDILFQYNDVVPDVTISHGVNYGFYAWGNTHRNNVKDNDFHGAFGNAIYIKGTASGYFGGSAHNEISGNDILGANAAMQLESIDSSTVSNNNLHANTTGSGYGLYLWGRTSNSFEMVLITNNTISGNKKGVYIKPGTYGDLTNFHINTNGITSNTEYGISNATGIVVDASKNYWGDAAGPENTTTNPSAAGDSVSDNVGYSPWWTKNYVGDPHSSPWTWAANSDIGGAINVLSNGDTLDVMAGTYPGKIDISKNVILKFATPPVLDSLAVNSDSLSLSSDVTISGGIDLTKGSIVTGDTNKIILDTSAINPTETSSGKIIGTVEVTPRETGTDSLHLLGLDIKAGSDDLGKVGLTRKTGSVGIITAGGNSGIATTWQISVDNQPTVGRTVVFSWLRDFDNGVDTNNVTVYRNEGTGWRAYAGPFSVSGNPRQITVNVTGFSDWTMGSSGDKALPIQATAFAASVDYDRVTLTWKTQSEMNNAGFNILRESAGATSFELIASYTSNTSLRGLGTNTSGKDYSFTDSKVSSGNTYLYKIQSVSADGSTEDMNTISVTVNVPKSYALYQNYPNPFNPSTAIRFDLKQTSTVTLDIYNTLGQRVLEENYGTMNAGRYNENINLAQYASGVYFYRIVAQGNNGDKFVSIKKLMLVK